MEGVRLVWQIPHQPGSPAARNLALRAAETMSSDGALAIHGRAAVSTQFHPCGTARTAPAGDPLAVADQHCQLSAIPILRVVDASFMSAIPRATINLSCVTTPERAMAHGRRTGCPRTCSRETSERESPHAKGVPGGPASRAA